MESFLQRARDSLRRERQRVRNRPMLEAIMAASALVAVADGNVSFSERHRIDDVLRNLDLLKIYDVHKAIDLFNDHIEAIRTDAAAGRKKALDRLRGIAGGEEDARLVVRVCLAISHADGDFSHQEKEAIGSICRVLALDAKEFEV